MVLTYLHVLDPEIPDVLQSMGSLPSSFSKAYVDILINVGHALGMKNRCYLVFSQISMHIWPVMTPSAMISWRTTWQNPTIYQQTQVWKCLSLGTSQWYDCPTPFRMMFSPDLPHPPTSSSTLRIVHVSWFFEDSSLPPTHGMVDLLAGPCTQSGCPSLHYLYYGFMYINYIK